MSLMGFWREFSIGVFVEWTDERPVFRLFLTQVWMVSFRFLRPCFFWYLEHICYICLFSLSGAVHLSNKVFSKQNQGSSKGSRFFIFGKINNDLTWPKSPKGSGGFGTSKKKSGKSTSTWTKGCQFLTLRDAGRLVKYHSIWPEKICISGTIWPVRGSGSEAVSRRIKSLGKMSSWRAKRAGGFTYCFVFHPKWGKTCCT